MVRVTLSTICRRVDSGWQLTSTPPNAAAAPPDLTHAAIWLPAQVPGTVADALRTAALWQPDAPAPLHNRDHWYRSAFDADGKRRLRFSGLATLAEVWLNGAKILQSENMFLTHEVDVLCRGRNELVICFRSLTERLAQPAKRPRWRQSMIAPGTLRSLRTSLLGHMPGWCPPIHAVGPWRAIELLEHPGAINVSDVSLRTTLESDGTGTVHFTARISGTGPTLTASLECAGAATSLRVGADNVCRTELRIPGVRTWWPHTHGEPALHDVALRVGAESLSLGRVGFRRIEIGKGDDGRGFTVRINGARIFCRGACWTNADLVGLCEDRGTYAPWLEKLRDANLNMVRVGGTMLYEGNAFYQLCDELGILVWQDFMFANFDYPAADEAFAASVRSEATQFLRRTQSSPSLAILCGGSEIAQQAAMLGLPPATWDDSQLSELLRAVSHDVRPDIPYVANSPSGGELPFVANSGVTHYYGVGAYQRPLEDARRAEVRFASECLAFANVPESHTLTRHLPVAAVHHPRWKERVPRDHGSSWDFEDVRDYYAALLYQIDPARVRRENPQRYLDIARATTAEVMEATFAEWRRARSTCAGALVWTLQDLLPGAGWGIIDATCEPKSAWYALRRACRPVQVALTDEGVNGLAIHVTNEHDIERSVRLEFVCCNAATRVAAASRSLTLAPRSTLELSANELLGRFFDTTYAYRFGPPAHEIAFASLVDANSGQSLADACYFPLGRNLPACGNDITMSVTKENGAWFLTLKSDRVATSLHIEDEHYRATDNWFHLLPGVERRIELEARAADAPAPDGEVYALNREHPFHYQAAA